MSQSCFVGSRWLGRAKYIGVVEACGGEEKFAEPPLLPPGGVTLLLLRGMDMGAEAREDTVRSPGN